MSSIGMTEEVCSHDEFTLIRTDGSPYGDIVDCDGDYIMPVPMGQLEAAEKCFPLIIAMYRKGERNGEASGKHGAQFAMRKALGL